MLEAAPTAATLAAIYRDERDDPATATGYTVGSTQNPVGFQLPAVSLEAEQSPEDHGAALRAGLYRRLPGLPPPPPQVRQRIANRFVARFRVLRDAEEGSNSAIYVREGIYETNYTFDPDSLGESPPPLWRTMMAAYLQARRADEISDKFGVQRQPRVYLWMPGDMAARSRAAEMEHLDDLRRAYALSLDHLMSALRGAVGRGPTEPDAIGNAEADFVGRLAVPVRGLGRNMARWGELYLALCEKSKGRDAGDHSFALELVDAVAVPSHLPITFLTGGQREENGRLFVKITTGTTRVPGARTQDLIVY